jgi:histidine triad (HIT) family protein
MIGLANSLAAEHADGDFRLVFNTGAGAGRRCSTCTRTCSGGLEEGSLGG